MAGPAAEVDVVESREGGDRLVGGVGVDQQLGVLDGQSVDVQLGCRRSDRAHLERVAAGDAPDRPPVAISVPFTASVAPLPSERLLPLASVSVPVVLTVALPVTLAAPDEVSTLDEPPVAFPRESAATSAAVSARL